MTQVLLIPILLMGVLSLLVLLILAGLAHRHKVRLGLLLNMFFHGMPVRLLCRVKGEMEEWGLKIDMQELIDAYLTLGAEGASPGEQELRDAVIKARTGRG